MAKRPKRPTEVLPADASPMVKPSQSPVSSVETARAADSVPAPIGPFATLPMKFGRYEIRKELGRGQMGAVYLAKDMELDRLVALKVARVSLSGSAKLLKRMEIEAKSAAKVDHPLICKVYDAGEIDGIRFIALQYIEGEDLKQYMKRVGRKLEPAEAVRLVLQILNALEAAHDKGVIHRDLKPENVMLNKKHEPVIMDFGLARHTIASSNAGLTQGMIVGTAAYMSPEQATGKAEDIDHRSDLYAVGAMLFEMLTGEWPFTGGAIEVMGKKCVQEPPSPLSLNPTLNPQLAAVCHKMIAKQKIDRYVTCAEVIKTLEAIDLNASTVPTKANVPAPIQPNLKAVEREPVFNFSSEPMPVVAARKKAIEIGKKKIASQKSALNFISLPSRFWHGQTPAQRTSVLGGASACLLVLAVVLFLPTSYGFVQIDIDDPTLSVKFEGSTITIANDGHPIRVTPTVNHTLSVLQNGIEIESGSRDISLKKGDRRTVKVSIVDGIATIDGEQLIPKTVMSNSTGMKLTLIPAGTFMMGSPESEESRRSDEGPQHPVEISRPFYMGVYEVTQEEFAKVTGGWNPSSFSQGGDLFEKVNGQDTRRFPVERVSWYDAIEFCNRLSEQDGLPQFYQLTNISRKEGSINLGNVSISGGNGYRLPTDAEWEYACRATTTTAFHFGITLNGELANVDGNHPYGTTETGKYLARTTTVGSYVNTKNQFGLFDMHGNVREWCFDVFDETAYGRRSGVTKDPVMVSGSTSRSLRGGSFYVAAKSARSAYRDAFTPDYRGNAGFRVVRSTTPAATTEKKRDETKKLGDQEVGRRFVSVSSTGQSGVTRNSVGKSKTVWQGWPADAPPPAIAPFDAAQARKHQEDWAAYLKIPVEHTNSNGMKFRLIPPGEFLMGSTKDEIEAALSDAGSDDDWKKNIRSAVPQHKVILTKPIYIGINEVTQEDYVKLMGKNPSQFSPSGARKRDVSSPGRNGELERRG